MATLEDLNKSISEMSREELLLHIKNARASRKVSKNKIKKRITKRDKRKDLLDNISKDDALKLLKMLGES